MDRGDFSPQCSHGTHTGSPYYRLYHPHLPTGKPFVDALVNSVVICGRKIGLCVNQVNFYYHVRITSDNTHSNVILRCNPLRDSGTPLSGSGPRDWFDWVEVNCLFPSTLHCTCGGKHYIPIAAPSCWQQCVPSKVGKL